MKRSPTIPPTQPESGAAPSAEAPSRREFIQTAATAGMALALGVGCGGGDAPRAGSIDVRL